MVHSDDASLIYYSFHGLDLAVHPFGVLFAVVTIFVGIHRELSSLKQRIEVRVYRKQQNWTSTWQYCARSFNRKLGLRYRVHLGLYLEQSTC